MDNTTYNSHVTIPKSLVKQWSKSRRDTIGSYYDKKNDMFHIDKDIDDLLKVEKYYSIEIEQFLNAKMERELGILRMKMLTRKFHITRKQLKKIRFAFTLLMLRTKQMSQLIFERLLDDGRVKIGYNLSDLMEDFHSKWVDSDGEHLDLFQDLVFMPVHNETDLDFIINTEHCIGIVNAKKGIRILFLPLTPQHGFILTNEDEFVKNALQLNTMILQDEVLVDWFNKSMLYISSNTGYIIGGKTSIERVLPKRGRRD